VNIGYTFSNIGKQKDVIKSLRVYVSGQNLFTFTKYPGLDPEMTVSDNSTSEGDRGAGVDWGTYPSAMTIMFGIDITL